MTDRSATRLAIWPFLVVDIIFLGLAYLIFINSHRPLTMAEAFALIACAGIGAWSFLTPFLRRDGAAIKLAESDRLNTTVAEIKNLEHVAAQVSSASNYLKTALDQSGETIIKSKEIAGKMAEETRAFGEFIRQANDNEKAHLRLEVDKLRRAELDWIQVMVHLLDQVFALHQAAVRSAKPALIEQIGNFQIICRDTVRRLGLICSVAESGQAFDAKLHQLVDGTALPEGGQISETLAAAYSYQGRIVRRALVRLQQSSREIEQNASPETSSEDFPVTAQEALL